MENVESGVDLLEVMDSRVLQVVVHVDFDM